jgi:hypothetical protein
MLLHFFVSISLKALSRNTILHLRTCLEAHTSFRRRLCPKCSEGSHLELMSFDPSFVWSIELFGFAIDHFVKQGDTVGLGPKPHLAGIGESCVVDLKQLFAVE